MVSTRFFPRTDGLGVLYPRGYFGFKLTGEPLPKSLLLDFVAESQFVGEFSLFFLSRAERFLRRKHFLIQLAEAGVTQPFGMADGGSAAMAALKVVGDVRASQETLVEHAQNDVEFNLGFFSDTLGG